MALPFLRRSFRASLLATVLAGSLAAQGQVHVVDPASPGAFATIQAAVDTAASGDTVLVRPSFNYYAPAVVDGKSLTIVGESSDSVFATSFTIRDLAPSQTVVLARFETVGQIELSNNDGLVWVEDYRRELDFPGMASGAGITVVDSGRVVLVRCSFEGGTNEDLPSEAGLDASGGSSVHAYECTFTGGEGGCSFPFGFMDCHEGGPGVLTRGANDSVFFSGCTVQGGDGKYENSTFFGSDCSAGGAGASAVGPVTAHASDVAGGAGGFNGTTQCRPDGPTSTGPVAFRPGSSLGFSTGPLAREGGDIVFAFRGPPDTPVWLMGSPFPRAEPDPVRHGTLLVGTPRAFDFMGTTDASGVLDVLVPLGLLAPSFDVRRTFLQPLMIERARGEGPGKLREQPSRITLGTGTAFVVLDETF